MSRNKVWSLVRFAGPLLLLLPATAVSAAPAAELTTYQ